MRYLLDTCVVSELVKSVPDIRVTTWIDSVDEDTVYLSVLTVGEIQKGIARLPGGNRRTRLQRWLDNDLRIRFAGRILPVSEEIAATWGSIEGAAELQGRPIPTMDGLIGATAVSHNLTLVTRDETALVRTGARLMNPWSAES